MYRPLAGRGGDALSQAARRSAYAASVLFDAIFLTLFFLTWLLLAAIPWLLISLRRRAHGALWALPFALLGGAGGGVLVPLAGLDDGWGVGLSMLAAPLGGAALTWAALRVWDDHDLGRRFARWATPAAGEQSASPVDSPGDSDRPPSGREDERDGQSRP